MRLVWVTASALAFAAMGACSQSESATTVPVGSVSADIQGGQTDTKDNFAVGVCEGPRPGQCDGICSGALIAPNLVATARHCVSESPEEIDCTASPTFGANRAPTGFFISTNTVMVGTNADTVNGWYSVEKIFVPEDDHVCGNDIALIQLSTSVPATVATPITPGVQHQMWDTRYYSSSFTAIGYGLPAPQQSGPGAGGTDGYDGAGTRRSLADVLVVCVPGSNNACPAVYADDVADAEFIGGDGPCEGDSGSSAYETTSYNAGTPVSFGVLSRGGESQDGTTCQGSVYSRFDAHRDFVVQTAQEASSNWTLYAQPSWTGTPDSPAGADGGSTSTLGSIVLGAQCSSSKECVSGLCAQVLNGSSSSQLCTQKCEDSSTCGDGFSCQSGYCLETASTAPVGDAGDARTETVVTTHGCSFAASGSRGSSSAAGLAGLALVLTAARRRRRA